MNIDWFVLSAQLVNFLILIYLLKRFLYSRIIQAMNERESRIKARFDEARKAKKEAEESAGDYEKKKSSLHAQEEKLLNEAREAANRRKTELMNSAREEVDLMRQRWYETVLQEKKAFLESLRQRTGKQVYAIARKILADLADTDIEEKMIDVLIEHVRSLNPEDKEKIRSALSPSRDGFRVQSAFPLNSEDRRRISDAVREMTGNPSAVLQFQESSELINGIEFLAAGHRIAWSVGDYLDRLEESFDRALHEEVRHPLSNPQVSLKTAGGSS